jgi:hypothetical protein
MAIAEDLTPRRPLDERSAPPIAISVATIAVVASALLIYISQAFLVAEMLGVKRELQVLLIIPVAVAACYYFVSRPGRLLDPLILFSIVKLVTEIALRGQWSYILDSLAAVLALTVLACAPARTFETGAKFVVTLAGILALMALLQWVMLILNPELSKYVLVVSDEGAIENTVEHPIALLGIHGEQDYSLLGQPLARMQSFAKEPSLNVIYFLLPACLAFLLNSRSSLLWGGTILTFCVLSLSGSIFLALAFAALWWLLLRVTSIRFAVPYGMLIFMGAFLFAVGNFGSQPLLDAIAYIAQYGDFLTKTVSLTDRSAAAVAHMDAALAAPFGSATISDLPGPWLVNSALAAGWLGVLLLVLFLRKLGYQLDVFHSKSPSWSARRLGSLLLVGALAAVIVFNDYQMGNYAGLILLAFIYRTLQLRNQRDGAVKADSHAPVDLPSLS